MKFHLRALVPAFSSLLLCSGLSPALAATGQITLLVKSTGGAFVQTTPNISGPHITHGGGTYTASFPSLTNASGSLTVDTTSGSTETLFYASFTTIVSNGSCQVNLANSSNIVGGGGVANATYTLTSVNPKTCDFTATFTDVASTGAGGGSGSSN